MKLALISDIHFGKNTNHEKETFGKYGSKNYINTFGSQFEELYPQFIEKRSCGKSWKFCYRPKQ